MAMEDELQSLRTENIKVKELLLSATNKHTLDEFRDNDEKVKYFTGLPKFTVLWALFQFVKPKLPEKQCLDKFQFLMLCLMRLRLDLPLQFLAFEFNISPSSVSRFFAECIDILYKRLKPSVRWPEREQLRKTMPMQFRKHFNNKVAVIIDCFEIFIERPSNLIARASTWSSYKHHHTAKYLVGITPQGSVSYISQGWGGRTSDKYITEHSGFLSNIVPGDLILADRGFDIADSVGCLCAEAKIPAFTKGRDQLSPLDIENTRKLASCRIQVERVIGLVRQKYTLLSGTCSLEYMACKPGEKVTQLDKIVVSACGLANMCPSVVDFN